ncbi:MAG TPA: SPFH domain-containing protein [Kofleriaceae bacterium]
MKLALCITLLVAGCAYQTVQPGHLGLRYEAHGGLHRDTVPEGRYNLGWCLFRDCGRIIDFDVTFSTAHQELKTTSQEGLALDLELSVIYKPIIAELYELDTEVGTNYYDEVVGPEFRSAASGVFARHPYTELAANKEKIEDEIEKDVQRRIKGKHVVIASITLESIAYAPEIQTATRERIVGEQEAIRQKAAMENEALKQKRALEQETERKQQEIQNTTQEQELKLRMDLAEKKNEREIAEEDALLEKAKAAATVVKARADAEAMTIMARAHADENRAQTQSISPLTVQMKAYEALGQLGGTGTTILLGDFSHIPQFLFPAGFGNGAVNPFIGGLPHGTAGAGAGGHAAK